MCLTCSYCAQDTLADALSQGGHFIAWVVQLFGEILESILPEWMGHQTMPSQPAKFVMCLLAIVKSGNEHKHYFTTRVFKPACNLCARFLQTTMNERGTGF